VRNSWLTLLKNSVFARSSAARHRPAARLLVGGRVADRGDHLRGGQLVEAAVAVVERAVRAERGDHHAVGARLIGRRQGQRDRGVRGDRPRAAGQLREPRAQIGDHVRAAARADLGDRPARRRRERDRRRRDVVVGRHAARSRAARDAAALVQQIEDGERHVARVLGQRRRGLGARFLRRLRVGRAVAQRAQRPELARGEHDLGRLGDGREHAADAGGCTVSSGTGLYATLKCVSSTKPLRSTKSSRSSL
jgi:hypothetical protein